MKKKIRLAFLTGLLAACASLPLLSMAADNDPLHAAYKAHGGLDTWLGFSSVEYDLVGWPFSQKGPLTDHQTADLKSRRIRVESSSYQIGFNGDAVWVTPNAEAVGVPPRFYASTPFYFFVMPFVFHDPGVNLQPLGTKKLGKKTYNAVKITYDENVGDTPQDNYVAYLDADTDTLAMAHYVVTYPAFVKGKSIEELERHAIVYQDWQKAGGLLVPRTVAFHEWKAEKLGKKLGEAKFENVVFGAEPPPDSLFRQPFGAIVDMSHEP